MSAGNLQRLVDLVADKLKAADLAVGKFEHNDARSDWHKRHRDAMQRIADELAAQEGAKFGHQPAHDHSVRLAGIRSSSTSGLSGALHNWMTVARKRIAKEAS